MSRLLLIALAPLAGCIIYEKDVIHHGPDCYTSGCGGYYDSGDTGSAEEPETTWLLAPQEITAGETLILSLASSPASDYTAITGLEFYGDIVVCTSSARTEELLVTVTAASDALAGPVDLVIEFADGTAVWVDDAINVLSTNGDQPEDGSGDAGSGDGSGDADTDDDTAGCG